MLLPVPLVLAAMAVTTEDVFEESSLQMFSLAARRCYRNLQKNLSCMPIIESTFCDGATVS